MSKRLLVLRHAKAEVGLGLADHERPLADRGRRDSAAMGDFLRARGLEPDLVLCSTALRTRQTLEGLGLSAPVRFERSIYTADGRDLLDLVRLAGAEAEDAGTILLVGHNPAVHELVIVVGNEQVEDFPTCSLGVIELADWQAHGGTLLDYRTPRTI